MKPGEQIDCRNAIDRSGFMVWNGDAEDSAPARSSSRFVVRVCYISLALLAGFAVATHVSRATTTVHPEARTEHPLDVHLRASQLALADARRCAAELYEFAARQPGPTARALEIAPDLIAASGGRAELAALAVQSVGSSLGAVESAARGLARAAAGSPPTGSFDIMTAGDLSGRAHRAAVRLCEARESVAAATLMPAR
jgi:hypothetical protein